MARYDWPEIHSNKQDRLLARGEFNLVPELFSTALFLSREMIARAVYLASLPTSDDLLWLPIGPSSMINGQATGKPVVAGRVRDVRVSPDGKRAYAASANGGVWYTNNEGASWHPLGGWALRPAEALAGRAVQSLTIGALDVHFGATSATDVVYAATGEAPPRLSSYPGGKHLGVGILRLDDPVDVARADLGGNPWQTEATNLTGSAVYRLTHDPAADLQFDRTIANTMVAATSTGLYSRSGPFVAGASWIRKEDGPFDFSRTSDVVCTDVLWTGAVAAPIRLSPLWIAIVDTAANPSATDGRTDVYMSPGGLGGSFTRIHLPGRRGNGRIGLAASVSDPSIVYALGTLANKKAQIWRINPDLSVHRVANTPEALFGKPVADTTGTGYHIKGSQADYDLAITVDPGSASTIYVGGSFTWPIVGDEHNASIYKLDITADGSGGFQTNFSPANQRRPSNDHLTFEGQGIHADVHHITIASNGMWVGCDGGVFRKDAMSTKALNTGLAVSEPGYVASHPTLDGMCIAGTQDNGLIERVGDTVWRLWRKGDGGGVGYHPLETDRYAGQYVRGAWYTNTAGTARSLLYEKGTHVSFYSSPAIASGQKVLSDDTLDPATLSNARIAIGTRRLLYADDWKPSGGGQPTWQSLPSGDSRTSSETRDRIGNWREPIQVVKWASEGDPKDNFNGSKLLVLSRYHILQYTLTDGTWDKYDFNAEKAKNRITSNSDIPDGPSEKLPGIGLWTDLASHDENHGLHGSFYISCTGNSKLDSTGAIDEDEKMDTLWWFDGTNRFFPTGLRNTPHDAVTGTSGSKAPAYAVLVDPDHAEIVYVANAFGVWKGTFAFAGPLPTWQWRGVINGLPQAVVQDLSFHKNGDLRLLRAALQSRGVWELDVSDTPKSVGRTYLRSFNLDTGRAATIGAPPDVMGDPTRGAPEFHESPDVYAVKQDGISTDLFFPDEVALYQRTENLRINPGAGIVEAGAFKVHVLVHHRHTTPMRAADASVLLLKLDNVPVDLSTVALSGAWAQAVMTIIGGSNVAPAGWTIADSTNTMRSPANDLDARNPSAATFDVAITHAAHLTRRTLFLAIVTSLTDGVTLADLTHPNLEDLLRKSSHAAARQVSTYRPII